MELLCRTAEGANGGSGWREFFGGTCVMCSIDGTVRLCKSNSSPFDRGYGYAWR
jgi:hypothetical protein